MKPTWVQDCHIGQAVHRLMALQRTNEEYCRKTGAKYFVGNPHSKKPYNVGIYFEDPTRRTPQSIWVQTLFCISSICSIIVFVVCLLSFLLSPYTTPISQLFWWPIFPGLVALLVGGIALYFWSTKD